MCIAAGEIDYAPQLIKYSVCICTIFPIASSSGGGHYPHDVKTQSGLTSIYNEHVVRAEHMQRPLSSSGGSEIHHEGVRYALTLCCQICGNIISDHTSVSSTYAVHTSIQLKYYCTQVYNFADLYTNNCVQHKRNQPAQLN